MHPIASDPEIMSGTPCFAGTRVPVKNLFDAISRGRTLDYFLAQFPSVTREQALAVLELASRTLLQPGDDVAPLVSGLLRLLPTLVPKTIVHVS